MSPHQVINPDMCWLLILVIAFMRVVGRGARGWATSRWSDGQGSGASGRNCVSMPLGSDGYMPGLLMELVSKAIFITAR